MGWFGKFNSRVRPIFSLKFKIPNIMSKLKIIIKGLPKGGGDSKLSYKIKKAGTQDWLTEISVQSPSMSGTTGTYEIDNLAENDVIKYKHTLLNHDDIDGGEVTIGTQDVTKEHTVVRTVKNTKCGIYASINHDKTGSYSVNHKIFVENLTRFFTKFEFSVNKTPTDLLKPENKETLEKLINADYEVINTANVSLSWESEYFGNGHETLYELKDLDEAHQNRLEINGDIFRTLKVKTKPGLPNVNVKVKINGNQIADETGQETVTVNLNNFFDEYDIEVTCENYSPIKSKGFLNLDKFTREFIFDATNMTLAVENPGGQQQEEKDPVMKEIKALLGRNSFYDGIYAGRHFFPDKTKPATPENAVVNEETMKKFLKEFKYYLFSKEDIKLYRMLKEKFVS